MKMTYLSLFYGLLFAGCGIDNSPHYADSKNFGREPNSAPDDAPAPMPTPVAAPTPDISTPPNPDAAPTDIPAPIETKPTIPTVPADPIATSEDGKGGNQTLNHLTLAAYFNTDHLNWIGASNSQGEGTLSDALGCLLCGPFHTAIATALGDNSRESLDIRTIEDGPTRNDVPQLAQTANGDWLSRLKGDDSQSGLQTLHWLLSKPDEQRECPTGFICMDRMTWIPESGQTYTYCYFDQNDNPLAVPYSPNPQYDAKTFDQGLTEFRDPVTHVGFRSKVSGPVTVKIYKDDVKCDTQELAPWKTTLTQWTITKLNQVNAQHAALKIAVHKTLKSDMEISVGFKPYSYRLHRGYQPGDGDTLRDLARLNTKMTYFINSDEKQFTKMIRTVQTNIDAKALQFLQWGVTGSYPVGLELEYNFEFCAEKGNAKKLYNHCTGRSDR